MKTGKILCLQSTVYTYRLYLPNNVTIFVHILDGSHILRFKVLCVRVAE